MYSDKKNVLQLVALLKAYGIRYMVLSPRSRNSPVVHSLVVDPFFSCYTVVDERSAGFFAIGIIQQVRQPVAVCCTSGTAVLNLGSAVAEAFYQQLPLLVITADRPASWIGQMDGQTLPQPGIFRTLVKKSVQLPEPLQAEDEWYGNRLINEAILALTHAGSPGPVQINIPLSEPLFRYTAEQLPEVKRIRYPFPVKTLGDSTLKSYQERLATCSGCLLLVGQSLPDTGFQQAMETFAGQTTCVVLAEHLANLPGSYVIRDFDSILYMLSPEEYPEYKPDILITMGGHIVSKRIRQFLRTYKPKEHWHITPSAGDIPDTFQSVTDIIETDPLCFLQQMNRVPLPASGEKKQYLSLWKEKSQALQEVSLPFSDLYAVRSLMQVLPEHSALHLGNSSSVRYAQLFPLPEHIRVYGNRGTSGIDGSLSSATGYATVSEGLTFLLIGDLSFFYDMNGIWNKHTGSNLRIFLNNNGGGEIFHALPGLNRSEALEPYITGAHRTQAKGWAESLGFTYLSAGNKEELTEHLPVFTRVQQDRAILLEVQTSMQENTDILRNYYHQLKK